MPFGLSTTEVLIIAVIALLVFGAKRLPDIGSSLGKGLREFRRSLREVERNIAANQDPDALPPGNQVPRRDERSKKLSE